MADAFQSDAFQSDAFQQPVVVTGTAATQQALQSDAAQGLLAFKAAGAPAQAAQTAVAAAVARFAGTAATAQPSQSAGGSASTEAGEPPAIPVVAYIGGGLTRPRPTLRFPDLHPPRISGRCATRSRPQRTAVSARLRFGGRLDARGPEPLVAGRAAARHGGYLRSLQPAGWARGEGSVGIRKPDDWLVVALLDEDLALSEMDLAGRAA